MTSFVDLVEKKAKEELALKQTTPENVPSSMDSDLDLEALIEIHVEDLKNSSNTSIRSHIQKFVAKNFPNTAADELSRLYEAYVPSVFNSVSLTISCHISFLLMYVFYFILMLFFQVGFCMTGNSQALILHESIGWRQVLPIVPSRREQAAGMN